STVVDIQATWIRHNQKIGKTINREQYCRIFHLSRE
ncbi:hypothetical protein L914_01690, partial [Phytophthora nicotianae]